MTKTMRALIVPATGELQVADVPRPEPRPGEALVRVLACGVCTSTDWKVINGQMPWAGPPPFVLGHESVGEVVEVGPGVTALKPGDRVTRPVFPEGEPLGTAFGGFAEYGIVADPRAQRSTERINDYNRDRQRVIPNGLSADATALSISLAETASVVNALPDLSGRSVAVAGTGIAGLSLTVWAKAADAWVVTIGRRDKRLARASLLGADATVNSSSHDVVDATLAAAGGAIDGVLEAIGDTAFADRLARLVKPDGWLVAYGAPPSGRAFDERWRIADVKEQDAYDHVWDGMLDGRLNAESFGMVTRPFHAVIDALHEAREGHQVKIVIRMQNSA